MEVVTIGRKEDNDVVVNDPFVGRHHCQIVEKDGQYFVVDLDSTNGTFVNSKRITGQYRLNDSDIIRIGNTVLPWKRYFDKMYFKTKFVASKSPVMDSPTPCPPSGGSGNTGSQPPTPTPVQTPTPTPMPVPGNIPMPRQGFITFCLWFGIVCSFLGGAGCIFNAEAYVPIYGDEAIAIIFGLMSWVSIMGNVALLRRKKWGFYLNLGIGFVGICMNFIMSVEMGFIGLLIYMFGSWIFWAILHIKKSGVKYWDTMK